MRLSVSLDVPSLTEGLVFFGALGFAEVSRPLPTLANIAAGDARLLLIEKAAGSLPFPGAKVPRNYARHWTPVHLDLHVSDIIATRDKALAAGATIEAFHEVPGYPRVAFMADPFGHGFCLIESRREQTADEP